MKILYIILLSFLVACSPVKREVHNKYRFSSFSTDKISNKTSSNTILISAPQAVAGYETEQMLYTDKPYQLSSFVNNSWISPPAGMLTALMVQSLQHSNYFYAVASGPDADKTDYRLDSQLIALHQNFLMNPSVIEFGIQVVLTHIEDARVVGSKTFTNRMPCPSKNPYGGVIAANNAVKAFTKTLANYVVHEIENDSGKVGSH
ncbi:MAG: ABC-type transport auxiliary lipoprotein family protein [Legionellaceae bacterium]|nr:ABC-type transport auxiliary lipoprotein family protein [Legionellaceae bacterium]